MQMLVLTWNTEPNSDKTGGGTSWTESFDPERLMEFVKASKYPITIQVSPGPPADVWVVLYGMSPEEGRALMPKNLFQVPFADAWDGVRDMNLKVHMAIRRAKTPEDFQDIERTWFGKDGTYEKYLKSLKDYTPEEREILGGTLNQVYNKFRKEKDKFLDGAC